MTFHKTAIYHQGSNNTIPIIAYVHSSGFNETFQGKVNNAQGYLENHFSSIMNGIEYGMLTPNNPLYAIAVVWGDTIHKIGSIDTFLFGDLNDWKKNPEVAAGVFRRGKLINHKKIISCRDTFIMLGIEEKTRRTTKDLTQYLEREKRTEVQKQLSKSKLWTPIEAIK